METELKDREAFGGHGQDARNHMHSLDGKAHVRHILKYLNEVLSSETSL